eukprot:3671220-Pyramimonas_sp.AAC.1
MPFRPRAPRNYEVTAQNKRSNCRDLAGDANAGAVHARGTGICRENPAALHSDAHRLAPVRNLLEE